MAETAARLSVDEQIKQNHATGDYRRCPGNGRHWFAYRGWVGSSSPTCIRCEAPNPSYRPVDDPFRTVEPGNAACIRCGGAEDLMDRGMAPGMTYCAPCRKTMSANPAADVHQHSRASHMHAHGSHPHQHLLREVCSRPECASFETHDIHPACREDCPSASHFVSTPEDMP